MFFTDLFVRFFTSSRQRISTIIVGAGPAGLACGITARQLAPHRDVLILEKQPKAGGLCIIEKVGSFSFEVGCNQPSNGFKQTLQVLGIDHQFIAKTNECIFADGTILSSPFNFRTMRSFLSSPVSSIRFFWRAFYRSGDEMLSSITQGLNPKFANRMQASFSYPMFTPDINLGLLRIIMENSSNTPQLPIGGMAAVTKKMQERFISLGGNIEFGSECSEITKLPNGRKLVITSAGKQYEAEVVVSSDAWKYYPASSQPGLAMVTLLFAVRQEIKYPEGTHTIAFLPDDFTSWMRQINQEKTLPREFGFHCFVNSLAEQKGCYTVTAYIPTPRGQAELTKEEKTRISEYVIARITSRISGFDRAIVEKHILSPAEYVKQFGLANNIPRLIPPRGFIPPHEKRGVYFIGDSSTAMPNVLVAINSGIEMAKSLFGDPKPAPDVKEMRL